jgi:DNA invertase Pin-like site-specific DNA recombinase
MSEEAYAVVGYIKVSTSEQADSGAGLEAQRAAINSGAERRGWELVHVFEDAGASGKSMNGRGGLQRALEAVEAGTAEGLVVAKLDRLSRSLLDFAALMERARKRGWNLIALDLGVDTSTPSGEMMASVLATFTQFERRLIGQRTKDALAVKRAQGVVLGRPRRMSEDTVERIRELRRLEMSVSDIAHELNADGVPTATGRGALASTRRCTRAVLGSCVKNPEEKLREVSSEQSESRTDRVAPPAPSFTRLTSIRAPKTPV